MKSILISLLFFGVVSAEAYENHLTKSQQRDFLRAIQTAGLDIWHEGDFQYKYLGAGCNFSMKECWVYVEMKYNNQKQTAYCSGEGFTKFSEVYDADKNRITMNFQESILECMSTWPE